MAIVETFVEGYRLTREGRRIAVYDKLENLVTLAENWTEAEEFVKNRVAAKPDSGSRL